MVEYEIYEKECGGDDYYFVAGSNDLDYAKDQIKLYRLQEPDVVFKLVKVIREDLIGPEYL